MERKLNFIRRRIVLLPARVTYPCTVFDIDRDTATLIFNHACMVACKFNISLEEATDFLKFGPEWDYFFLRFWRDLELGRLKVLGFRQYVLKI